MKTTRRISIELQHREVTISFAGPLPAIPNGEPEVADSVRTCPHCGSPWITIAARVEGDVPSSLDRIHQALQQSGLHLQVSPAGQLRICQRSFEELKESL